MNRLVGVITIAVLLGLGLVVSFTVGNVAPAQERPHMATRWEYKTVNTRVNEAQMNKLGDEGWELVTYHELGGTACQVFKRPKR